MTFEIFTEHTSKEEIRQMLLALKTADYAMSTLPKTLIQKYADLFEVKVKLRKFYNGKVKVTLND